MAFTKQIVKRSARQGIKIDIKAPLKHPVFNTF